MQTSFQNKPISSYPYKFLYIGLVLCNFFRLYTTFLFELQWKPLRITQNGFRGRERGREEESRNTIVHRKHDRICCTKFSYMNKNNISASWYNPSLERSSKVRRIHAEMKIFNILGIYCQYKWKLSKTYIKSFHGNIGNYEFSLHSKCFIESSTKISYIIHEIFSGFSNCKNCGGIMKLVL